MLCRRACATAPRAGFGDRRIGARIAEVHAINDTRTEGKMMRINRIAGVALVCGTLAAAGCSNEEEPELVPPGAIPAAPDVRPGSDAGVDAAPMVMPGDSGAAATAAGGNQTAPAGPGASAPAADAPAP